MILISKKLIFTNVIHFTLPSAFFQHRCLSRTNYDNEVTIIPVKTPKSNNTLRIHNLMYSHNAVKRGGERSNFHRIFYSVELKEERRDMSWQNIRRPPPEQELRPNDREKSALPRLMRRVLNRNLFEGNYKTRYCGQHCKSLLSYR